MAARPRPADRTAPGRWDIAPTTGPGVLHLRRGVYVAEWAVEHGGVVTFCGRRRERDLHGDRLYPVRKETVRLRPGEWVEWLDIEPMAAAA